MSARRAGWGDVALLLVVLQSRPSAGDEAGAGYFAAPQSNYLLGCGGCHGVDGSSNSRLVPELRDQVGFFLNSEAGRGYLVRVPNVAFYPLSDRDLADMLNFMVVQIGRASLPPGAKPYTAAEVAKLRKQPLSETSLIDYRARLIDSLSVRHQAPRGLRVYGSDQYKRD